MQNKITIFICCLSLIVISKATIDPSRVILVNNAGQNLLFRTNDPVNKNTRQFEYDNLVYWMKNKTIEAGLTFPSEFELIDYSLLNPTEYVSWTVEIDFFQKNPQIGRLEHKIIIGSLIFPNNLAEDIRYQYARNYPKWDWDQLEVISTRMNSDLHNFGGKPKVIFFHCIAGEDRTGEVFGAYKMYVQDWSYKKALIFDNHVEKREMYDVSRNGMSWFCWWLYYTHQRSYLQCDYLYNPNDKLE